MTRWWREPYPSLVSPWKVVVVPAGIIFLVLYLLQPFGIARIESGRLWVTLGAFPTVLFAMWNRNIRLARNLREATELNLRLSQKPEVEETPPATLVFSGGTRETLELDARSFLYAESEGNYVRLHYLSPKDNRPVSKLLRLTMKQAEASVASAPFIVRCHRAFLVNLHQVAKVDGNSQGYRLRLEGCAEEVPVSRGYAKEIKERLFVR